jgi:hypothetical protein
MINEWVGIVHKSLEDGSPVITIGIVIAIEKTRIAVRKKLEVGDEMKGVEFSDIRHLVVGPSKDDVESLLIQAGNQEQKQDANLLLDEHYRQTLSDYTIQIFKEIAKTGVKLSDPNMVKDSVWLSKLLLKEQGYDAFLD